MKKIFVILLSLFTFSLGFVSCTSSEITESGVALSTDIIQEDLSELSIVQEKIDSLNQNMFINENYYETRSWSNIFKKFKAIAICDAVGGLFGLKTGGIWGAAAGTIVASAVAGFTPAENIIDTRSVSENDQVGIRMMNNDSIALAPSIIPNRGVITQEDSIGYVHNSILIELNYSLTSGDLAIDSIISKVAEKVSSKYDVTKANVMSYLNDNRSLLDNIINEELYMISEKENQQSVFNKWKKLYPRQVGMMNILELFFEGISNIEVTENDGTYLNNVLDIIDASDTSENLKMVLRNSIIVGNASYQLWNVEY